MTPFKQNFAVSGTGLFGREHLRTLSTMETLVSVANTDQAAATAPAERFGVSSAYANALETVGQLARWLHHRHFRSHPFAIACGSPAWNSDIAGKTPGTLCSRRPHLLIEAERKSPAFVLPITRFAFNA
jgi:hypothetical protein